MRFFTAFIAVASMMSICCAASHANPQVVHSFDDVDGSDGSLPAGGGVALPDGTLFGTTQAGGIANFGVVYRISASGIETKLHDFVGVDGITPIRQLVLASDGFLYGTTFGGGAMEGGTVFRISQDGSSFQTLHSFRYDEEHASVSNPQGLAQAADGAFYGVLERSGLSREGGAVFRMTPDGAVTVLHEFAADGHEGLVPVAAPFIGSDGTLYGTTSSGGVDTPYGTIFALSPGGHFKVVHRFTLLEGSGTVSPLCEPVPGVLVGVSPEGGKYGAGTAFRIDSRGRFKVLHHFGEHTFNASTPSSGLSLGNDGLLYGTSSAGGDHLQGTVYSMSMSGAVAVIDSFTGKGGGPYHPGMDRLVVDSDGALLGVTAEGGIADGAQADGTVFKEIRTLGAWHRSR